MSKRRLTEVSTDNRVLDMYEDYRADGMSRADAIMAVARNTEVDMDEVEDILSMYGITESKTKERRMSRKEKTQTITVPEEVDIPGTEWTLEEGDVIKVEEGQLEENVSELLGALHEIKMTINDYLDVISGSDWRTIKENLDYALDYIRRTM